MQAWGCYRSSQDLELGVRVWCPESAHPPLTPLLWLDLFYLISCYYYCSHNRGVRFPHPKSLISQWFDAMRCRPAPRPPGALPRTSQPFRRPRPRPQHLPLARQTTRGSQGRTAAAPRTTWRLRRPRPGCGLARVCAAGLAPRPAGESATTASSGPAGGSAYRCRLGPAGNLRSPGFE